MRRGVNLLDLNIAMCETRGMPTKKAIADGGGRKSDAPGQPQGACRAFRAFADHALARAERLSPGRLDPARD